ncbi:GDSL esterase/lipase At1g29670-like [Coffea arabica]|uniref:GDSL esterase/lipase At1g29670-like n=1 Tax=Coffea arabica TaxID=13443 RepID=A0A6P6W9A3_COFAR|nr:GDSL esterase/lipase At1g29670-like [Coffea arabica]
MAFVARQWFLLSIINVVVVCFLKPFALGEQQVPCYFIFGDSQDDNGNNNHLNTTARANYPPYGIDFPEGPTGRFTNGRNHADFIGELLGFDSYIPPFANTKGRDITKGINYASGASGILDQTGRHLGDLFSFNEQLHNHERAISRIVRLIGNRSATKEYLAKCLYTVALGNNDYINNYLLPEYYPTSHLYTPREFASLLIRHYSQQLRTLYRLGARKIAVFGLGWLGCIPAELSTDGNCVDSINEEVLLFNDKLKPLVDELNTELSGAQFLYVDVIAINLNNLSTPAEITIGNAPCCNVSAAVAGGQCIPGQIPCSNRNQYYFWDDFHPSEVVNEAYSRLAYSALSSLLDADPLAIGGLTGKNCHDKVKIQ